jgi:uncharacterized protein DUF1963
MSSAMSPKLENVAAVLLGALLAWAVTTWTQRDEVDRVAPVTREVNEPRGHIQKPPRDAVRVADLAERGASVARQRRALRRYLLGRHISRTTIAAVFRHTRNGIALRPSPGEARTRLGGQPLLPPGQSWPTGPGGHPFTFIAAFDFAELPRLDPLPRDGTLAL